MGFTVFPSTQFGATAQKAILAYASECWSAASSPAQEAAAVAFDTTPEMDLYRENVSLLHRHCTLKLYRSLKDFGLAVAEPKGAFYVYPSFHPYTKELQALGIRTSIQLAHWLIEEHGIATLPGSAFGEDDAGVAGGRYRLRMATSYLYFRNEKERYTHGYGMLAKVSTKAAELPQLEAAMKAIGKAVSVLKSMQ